MNIQNISIIKLNIKVNTFKQNAYIKNGMKRKGKTETQDNVTEQKPPAPCSGDNKRPLYNVPFSHATQCHRCLMLRECAIGRAVAR